MSSSSAKWKEGSYIRDPRTEAFLLSLLNPLYDATGTLKADLLLVGVKVDPSYNAFAALGNMVIVHSGFFQKIQSLEEMSGVLAHEVGHQMASHVLRTLSGVVLKASATAIFGAVAGLGAAMITGNPGAALAGFAGGSAAAQAQFTAYSRGQEATADDLGFQLLAKLKWPAKGFVQAAEHMLAMSKDSGRDSLPIYVNTHPIGPERLQDAQKRAKRSSVEKMPEKFQLPFELARARVLAFTLEENQVRERYKGSALPDTYALALLDYQAKKYDAALLAINKLISETNDPYFMYDKACILVEKGDRSGAISLMSQVIDLSEKDMPQGRKASLVRFERAALLLRENKGAEARDDLAMLEVFDLSLRKSSEFWNLYAGVYEKLGKAFLKQYSFAMAQLCEENIEGAKRYYKMAEEESKSDSQAADKLRMLDQQIKELEAKSLFR